MLIWFPTTKSQKLLWFTCVQVVHHILLEALNKGYNFVLDLTSIEGLQKKLWAFQVMKVPISGISRLPTWESRDKMTFGCNPIG